MLPSEVMRTRLQWPQKGRETGAMMPISPRPSAKVKRCAVSLAALAGSSTRPAGVGAGRPPRVEAGDDLVHADDCLGRPGARVGHGGGLFERHELDEAHDDALATGELGEGLDLRVVEAAQQHAVDLDRPKAGGLGGADAREHALIAARERG